jgi:hypothetical protein
MTESNTNSKEKMITISVMGIEKLASYERGIRGVLRKIEVGKCEPELMENVKAVKAVYELLEQLQMITNSTREEGSKSKHFFLQ